MSIELVDEGRPVVVVTPRDRIGHGPWARLFVTAVMRDEGSTTAEQGRALARAGSVHTLGVEAGELSARVEAGGREHTVTIRATPVPPRIWAAVVRSARGKRPLQSAVAGRTQSVQLEHEMVLDWEESLFPKAPGPLRLSCTCGSDACGSDTCAHVTAVTYVVADTIDHDPSLLLRWRGCVSAEAAEPAEDEPSARPADTQRPGVDPWQAGVLPVLRPLRPLPAGAVLKCLGPSGLSVGGREIAELLQRAYASFAASSHLPG